MSKLIAVFASVGLNEEIRALSRECLEKLVDSKAAKIPRWKILHTSDIYRAKNGS